MRMNCIIVVIEKDCWRRSEWVGFENRSNGERWRDWRALPPFLNTPWWSSRPSVERSGEISNGNKPCAKKGKRHPGCDESRVAALSGKGKHPGTEGSKSLK